MFIFFKKIKGFNCVEIDPKWPMFFNNIFGHLGGPVCTTCSKTHGLTPLSDAFFNAVHDELIEINIFYKNDIPAHIRVKKIAW